MITVGDKTCRINTCPGNLTLDQCRDLSCADLVEINVIVAVGRENKIAMNFNYEIINFVVRDGRKRASARLIQRDLSILSVSV